MDKYRHGSTGAIVEAARLTAENIDDVAMWTGAVVVEEIDPFTRERSRALNMPSPDGVVRVSQGQYAVKYGRDFYRALPNTFQVKYVPMDVPKGTVTPDVRSSKILREQDEE